MADMHIRMHDGRLNHNKGGKEMAAKYRETVGQVDSLTPQKAALLLIDHQVGLSQCIREMMR
jgi:hypothetical protein